MKIFAIGIYNNKLQKINSASPSKGFFDNSRDPLKSLSDSLTKAINEERPFTIYYTEDISAKEHHYFKKYLEENNLFRVIGISSQTPLMLRELHNLFSNINYIQNTGKFGLLNGIIANPIGYIGKELLIEDTKADLKNIQEVMLDNIDKASDHLIKIQFLLLPNTVELKKESELFLEKSKRPCCSF